LVDQVFKNIEYQLLNEEKTLLEILKRHQETNILIKEADDNLTNLMETINKTSTTEVSDTIKNEQEKYEKRLKTVNGNNSLAQNVPKLSSSTLLPHDKSIIDNTRRFTNANTYLSKKTITATHPINQSLLLCQNPVRIHLIEDLIQQFKFRTEENNYESLVKFYEIAEEANQMLYLQFSNQENEVF
jgi:hypothetical protein